MSRDNQVAKCQHITNMVNFLTAAKIEVVKLKEVYEAEKDERQVNLQMEIFHELSTNLTYYNQLFSEENAILAQIYLDDYNNMRKGGPSHE